MGDRRKLWLVMLSAVAACGDVPDPAGELSGGGTSSASASAGGTASSGLGSASADGSASGSSAGDEGAGERFDVGIPDGGAPVDPGPRCTVADALDAVPECDEQAPPDSFAPVLQWEWAGHEEDTQASSIPLVANLTDDNGDGSIDLCDVPDVVIVAYRPAPQGDARGHLYVLDGLTGALHWRSEQAVGGYSTPALGDIDGDGLPEIVVHGASDAYLLPAPILAFSHDGALEWTSPEQHDNAIIAISLADLDNDGDVEILSGADVLDHHGQLQWRHPDGEGRYWSATIAADLDGDDDMEVIFRRSAFHHDGTPQWAHDIASVQNYAQVFDADDDGDPEVLLTSTEGLTLLEADGSVIFDRLTPMAGAGYGRPAAVHDFDGDGQPEFATSAAQRFAVFEVDGSLAWWADVADDSGWATGTGFDFLGDGVAEAMYADEDHVFVFDGGTGLEVLRDDRSSHTQIEYPVVADVDNDGSAEILVVSNQYNNSGAAQTFTLRVLRDAEDRWIQARRIWNQHAYHVTNVREDGTIPAIEPKHWRGLNTFRTNSQLTPDGSICQPTPAG